VGIHLSFFHSFTTPGPFFRLFVPSFIHHIHPLNKLIFLSFFRVRTVNQPGKKARRDAHPRERHGREWWTEIGWEVFEGIGSEWDQEEERKEGWRMTYKRTSVRCTFFSSLSFESHLQQRGRENPTAPTSLPLSLLHSH